MYVLSSGLIGIDVFVVPPGITPMLQVIRAVLKNPKDNLKMFLIFANQVCEFSFDSIRPRCIQSM